MNIHLRKFSYQLYEVFTLSVYCITLPPNNLVTLPCISGHLLRILALHATYLALLVDVLLLQRLEEALHTSTQHSVKLEAVAAQVAEYIRWIWILRPYIYCLATKYLPLYL